MKIKKLNAPKEEAEAVSRKLSKPADEELAQVSGGISPDHERSQH